jgi:hypothetical protein
MPKKPKTVYPPFQEAQILWECDFPSKPELLESLLRERIGLKQSIDLLEVREKEINVSLLAFFTNNRIPGTVYEGYTISKKSGASSTINREALMLAGVTAEVIDRCISRTPWETVECRENKHVPSPPNN